MALFESIFDISYLILVIILGIRLLLQREYGAKLFGAMACLLGTGDAFHLIPRLISYWSEGGFAANAAALSWGEFVTSITMTMFYLLFYYFYKHQTGEQNRLRELMVYALVAVRLIFLAFPQNGWGNPPGDYYWAILRNVPFVVLGILLITWSWKERQVYGLSKMAVLISLSFMFYLPVVLWARWVPWVGALMMPKTVTYLLMVIIGFKIFIPSFSEAKIETNNHLFKDN